MLEEAEFYRKKRVLNSFVNYKNLKVWELSYNLVVDFYPLINSLPEYESKNLVDQMRRAVTSLPINITEGASSRFKRTYYNHLGYAYASGKELEVLLMLCKDFRYISQEKFNDLQIKLEHLCVLIFRLIKQIKEDI